MKAFTDKIIIVISLWYWDKFYRMNFSKQREKILETLVDNAVHPSAEYLHKKLLEDKEDLKIGIATVYRNLNQLSENGTIKRIEGLDGSVHYDHNIHMHYHFFCTKCRKIFDIPADISPDIVKKAEEATGFKIDTHEIVFHGECSDCKIKGEENG